MILVKRVLAACAGSIALLSTAPAAAQGAICCNLLVDLKGNWFGALRNCPEAFARARPEHRAAACEQLGKQACAEVRDYCPGCDEAALRKLREDYRRLFAAYQEIREAADAQDKIALEVLHRVDELIYEYVGGKIKDKLMSLLGKAERPYSVYTAQGRDDYLKEVVSVIKDAAKAIRKGAYKGATKAASVVGMVMEFGFLGAKVAVTFGEFERYMKEAQKERTRALETLKKLRAVEAKIAAIENACRKDEQRSRGAQREDEEQTEDEFKPSGQREYEAALAVMQSWRRADGLYQDAQGNVHTAQSAFDQALRMIQSRGKSALESPYRKVAASDARGAPDEKRVAQAGPLIAVALDRMALALEAHRLLGIEVRSIVELAADTKPAPRR